jgi:hypothetical protein
MSGLFGKIMAWFTTARWSWAIPKALPCLYRVRANWVRQRLAGHSDAQHALTYTGIEPLPFPAGLASDLPAPTGYEGTIQLRDIVDGSRTFIEWSVALDPAPQDTERWKTLFQSWIPDWTRSLDRALGRRAA